ncbi:MAG: Alkaline phosphatase [uncultured Phycisphaerae bacterium]|uniref:Alkaline phosphatase n=1 Tax=uncultured Phycisphaerae bacterium TaxID=904963 RepID=A0A6J4PYR2_9BACT|nr:MAG: Alkaline phosphatase [uncultured Phycisphaerae bacterium]
MARRAGTGAGGFARYTAGASVGRGVGPENGAAIRDVTLFNDLDTIGGNDAMAGGDGDDRMFGQLGDDAMNGNDGNDDLVGHLGADAMDGGAGDDALVGDKGWIVTDILDGSAARVIKEQGPRLFANIEVAGTLKRTVTLVDAAIGSGDVLTGGLGNDSLHGGAGDDTLYGDGPGLTAGGGSDILFGDLGNDALLGGAGDDHLWGGAGDDLLDGQAGADTAFGGSGDDRLVADVAADQLIDWTGPRNTFVTPTKGSPTVIRSPAPQVRQWLLDLAASDGAADPMLEIGVLAPSQL